MGSESGSNEIKLKAGASAWRRIEEETILLDLQSSQYLGVNSSGSVLWPAIAEGTTRDELAAILAQEFDLTPARAAADVDAFISACRARDLLES